MQLAEVTPDGPPTERVRGGVAAVEFSQMLTRRCVDLLGADAASLVFVERRGDLRAIASSDERAHNLELFEIENREGPGVDCYVGGEPVVNQPLDAAGSRWPTFSRHARAAGFGSAHAFPLRRGGDVIGMLNLFTIETALLGEREADASQAMADVAAIGLLQTQALEAAWVLTGQLQGALDSRVVIEQAKGILAARANVHVDTAFRLLRTYARNHNALLSAVANAVVDFTLPAEDIATSLRREGGKQPRPVRPPPAA